MTNPETELVRCEAGGRIHYFKKLDEPTRQVRSVCENCDDRSCPKCVEFSQPLYEHVSLCGAWLSEDPVVSAAVQSKQRAHDSDCSECEVIHFCDYDGVVKKEAHLAWTRSDVDSLIESIRENSLLTRCPSGVSLEDYLYQELNR